MRNAALLIFAAMSASLEAPRLARQPIASATAELTHATAAIDSTAVHVASTVRASHLGFDTNVYPGDAAMNAWRQSGAYEWVGYYLPAPCHSDASWSGKRARLVNTGWGLAVIYVGQQTWGKRLSDTPERHTIRRVVYKKTKHGRRKRVIRTMTRESKVPVAKTGDGCSASFVNAAQGRLDARDAIAKARHEGFAKGTVIFLDVEYMETLPQRMRDYYSAWAAAVLADGRYRPGIYAHTKNASTIYDDVSDVYDKAGVQDDPPFWVAGSRGFAPGRAPTDVGHAFASVWQGLLDVVRTHNGISLPVDLSVASVASPSSQ